jgi:CYTH domain-containing protein
MYQNTKAYAMQINSLEISDKLTLINYFKHNSTLLGNPDIQVYLDADISVKTVRQSDLVPTQTYAYTDQLNFLRELHECLQKQHGIDFLNQKGFMTYEIGGEKFTLYPPLVEVVDGKMLLVDGTHRVTYAGRKDASFSAVIVKNVSPNWKNTSLAAPCGWEGIQEFGDFEKEAPAGFVKRYKRYESPEEYKYYFRNFIFPGHTKIIRTGTSVKLNEGILRSTENRNLRNEREVKWVLPGFVLPKTNSYLIKFGTIVQGYMPAGNNLHLDGNILNVSGKPALSLGASNVVGIRDGILDFLGNFPDDSEFRYRRYDKKLVATFKNVTANSGRDRLQVEFEITKKKYDLLRGLAAEEIQKSRCIIPDGNGFIEIDFYDRPNLSFVSIEREFLEDEDPRTYALPSWLARLRPINVTHDPAFKNKNITKLTADGRNAANVRFEEIMRAHSR